LDKNIYGVLREEEKHDGLLVTLKLLKAYRQKNKIRLTVLIMVTQATIDAIEARVELIIILLTKWFSDLEEFDPPLNPLQGGDLVL
jgi:hypothetical protein